MHPKRRASDRTKGERPMNAEGVIQVLDQHREELRRLGVRRLGLFGSTARNEATEASDLDFLVEFQQKSFDAYMDLKSLLESLFSRRVDLVLPETLKPRLRDRIAKDVQNYVTGL
jgi:predicted nucleotidyltransferase